MIPLEEAKDTPGEDEKVDLDAGLLGSPNARSTEDWQNLRQCAEVISLCRVRDAMGPGMEAMMGYLRYVYLCSE